MSKTLPPKLQTWIEARKRHKLSDMHIQMARGLGLNPKKLGNIDNHKQESWKLPLPQFIEKIYFKHFKKNRPDIVKSIEQMHAEQLKKKQKKALRKAEKDKNNAAYAQTCEDDMRNNLEKTTPLELKISFGRSMFEAEDAIAKAMNEAKKKLLEGVRKKQNETTKV